MALSPYFYEDLAAEREAFIEALLNARLQSIHAALGGNDLSVSLAGLSGNVDLTPTQAKYPAIKFTGNPAAAVTVRIPHATGARAIIEMVNACGGSFSTLTVKSTGANLVNSAGVSVLTGKTRRVRHDGESAYPAGAELDTLTGLLSLAYLATRPVCRLRHSVNISIPNNVAAYTTLSWDTETSDTDAMHDTVTNNSRITFKTAGRYVVSYQGALAASNVGERAARIIKGGVATVPNEGFDGSNNQGATSGTHFQIVTGPILYAVNDYVEVQVFQNSGAARDHLKDYSHFAAWKVD